MKTNEFIKEVEAMGFEVSLTRRVITIRNSDKEEAAKTFTDRSYSFFNNYTGFINLSKYKQQQLFKLLTEYASTPIKEREEEKKYRYYLKNTTGLNLNHGNLLYKQKEFNNFMFDIDMFNEDEIKCEFTHQELRACGINLTLLQENYEEIEVTE